MAQQQPNNAQIGKTQKQRKIQWGVSSPLDTNIQGQYLNNEHPYTTVISQYKNENVQQNAISSKKGLSSGIDFQNLPVKESQIISNSNKGLTKTQIFTHFGQAKQGEYYQNRQAMNRLNMIKNQFAILKDMMINSSIDQNHRHQDNMSNVSKSNVGYSGKSKPLKTGEVIRGKDKFSRKSKISSSSASDKGLKSHRSVLKEKSDINEEQLINRADFLNISREKNHIKESKMSKSKHSQNLSQHSRRNHSKTASRLTQRQQQLKYAGFVSNSILEKQSLEIQLRNSLEKTQILIQNQILLKTRNHQLEEALKQYINKESNKQNQKYERKIQQLNSIIRQYEDDLNRERLSHKQHIEKIGKLEADLVAHEAVTSLLKQEKIKQASSAMSMKLACANLQIENKRLMMEKQIEMRDKKFEIERLTKEIEMYRNNGSYQIKDDFSNPYKEKIRFLELELEQRDRKYKQMFKEVQNKRYLRQQAELMELIEKLHKNRHDKQESSISRELSKLKEQMLKIKNQTDLTQSQFGFESKVISLQQALKKDSEQKQKHLLEIQRFQKEYEILKSKYRNLELQKSAQIQQYMRLTNKLRNDLEEAIGFRQKYDEIKRQNSHLHLRIDELQTVIKNYEIIQEQVSQLRQSLKQKDLAHNREIKDARRRVEHAEFEAYKSQQQSKFNLDISSRKFSSEMEILVNQIRALQADKAYLNDQLNSLRQQNDELVLRVKDLQFSRDQRKRYETQADFEAKEEIRRQHQQEIDALSKKFYTEEQRLVEQVSNLTKINQQMKEYAQRAFFLESQNHELRALCKRKITTDTSILHLWEIKQIQYQNLNAVMSVIKPSSIMTPASRRQSNLAESVNISNSIS